MNKFRVKVDLSLNSEDYFVTEGLRIAEIWDASKTYLPDFTPKWLYKILESLPGEYGRLQESVFECDDIFLEALKNHPNCEDYKEIGKKDEDSTEDENTETQEKEMTVQEAINLLISHHVGFTIDDLEESEKFPDAYDAEMVEMWKEELKAYLVIFGKLDPSLSTIEAIKTRSEEIEENENYEYDSEPGEVETELCELLDPWYSEETEKLGCGTQFELTEEENEELRKVNDLIIYEESGGDTFAFYPYKGRVCVIYNEESDIDFCEYGEEFQKKALEIISRHLKIREIKV